MYDKLKSIYPKLKRVAIIRPDDPGFKFPEEYTVKEIEKRGMEVVAREVFRMPTDDFYPILTKVLAQKPDSIELISSILPFAKGVIEQARELGFTGPITSIAHVADVNQLKNALNPKYAYDLYLAGPDVMSPKMPPMIREFAKLVEKVSKDKMDFVARAYPAIALDHRAGYREGPEFRHRSGSRCARKHAQSGNPLWTGEDGR